MRLTKIIAVIMLVGSFSSCSEGTKYYENDVLAEEPFDLQLDGDKKWVVDEGMMVSIKEMENNINSFEGKEVADYKALSKTTKTNLSDLTSSCTMKGQSHDELHKWLIPFFDLNKALKKTKTIDDGEATLESMKYQLFVFNVYFE